MERLNIMDMYFEKVHFVKAYMMDVGHVERARGDNFRKPVSLFGTSSRAEINSRFLWTLPLTSFEGPGKPNHIYNGQHIVLLR